MFIVLTRSHYFPSLDFLTIFLRIFISTIHFLVEIWHVRLPFYFCSFISIPQYCVVQAYRDSSYLRQFFFSFWYFITSTYFIVFSSISKFYFNICQNKFAFLDEVVMLNLLALYIISCFRANSYHVLVCTFMMIIIVRLNNNLFRRDLLIFDHFGCFDIFFEYLDLFACFNSIKFFLKSLNQLGDGLSNSRVFFLQ